MNREEWKWWLRATKLEAKLRVKPLRKPNAVWIKVPIALPLSGNPNSDQMNIYVYTIPVWNL